MSILRAAEDERHRSGSGGNAEVDLEQARPVVGDDVLLTCRGRRGAAQIAVAGSGALERTQSPGADLVAAQEIARPEQIHVAVEGAFDAHRELVAEDHHVLPRHHVATGEIRAAVDGKPHTRQRSEVLAVRDRHRTRAGNDHTARTRIEFSRDADAAVEQRERAVDGKEPLGRQDGAGPGDKAAQRGNAGAAGDLARRGDGRADVDLEQTVFAVFDPQPVAVPLDVDLGAVGEPHTAAEGHVQTGRDAIDAAADGLEHQPGGAERHVEVADADGHAVQIPAHDGDGAAELVVEARQFDVAADAEGGIALVDAEEHVGKLELADLEVRDLEFAHDVPAERPARVGDRDVFVVRQVDRQLFAFDDLQLHLSLQLELHRGLAPVDGQGDAHAGQSELHPEDLGIDAERENVGDLGDMLLLRLFEHLGVLLRAELADDRDRFGHDDEFEVARVVALVGVLRLDGQIGGLGAALDNELRSLDRRRGQDLFAVLLVGDGEVFGRPLHDGREIHRVYRFRIPTVFEPQHVRRFAEERGVVREVGLRVHRHVIPGFAGSPLLFVAAPLERDRIAGILAGAETDGTAVEGLFGAAEVHLDLSERPGFADKPQIGVEGVLPVLHVEAAVAVVEGAVTDGYPNVIDFAVRAVDVGVIGRPRGVVGEVLDLAGHLAPVVPGAVRVIGDGIVAQIDLDGDGGLGHASLVDMDVLAGDDPGKFRSRIADEGAVDRRIVQFAAVDDLDMAILDDQIVGDGAAVVIVTIPVSDQRISGFDDDVVGDAAVQHVQQAVDRAVLGDAAGKPHAELPVHRTTAGDGVTGDRQIACRAAGRRAAMRLDVGIGRSIPNLVDHIVGIHTRYGDLVGGASRGVAALYRQRLQGETRSVDISLANTVLGNIFGGTMILVPGVIASGDGGVILAVAQSQIFRVARRSHLADGDIHRGNAPEIFGHTGKFSPVILLGVGVRIPRQPRAAVVERTEDVPRLMPDHVHELGILGRIVQQHVGVARTDPLRQPEERAILVEVGCPPDADR